MNFLQIQLPQKPSTPASRPMPAPLDLLPLLLKGLGMTVVITIGGCLLALACAFAAGLGRRSSDLIVRWLSAVYIEVFRGTSALVQMYWFYFALPLLLGVELNSVFVGILVLGLNIGAYGAEVVRAAIAAVPPGQQLAATALNLSRWQTMRHVILPQALLMMLPPLGNLMIELIKSTALVSTIAVMDLTRAGIYLRDDMPQRTVTIFTLLLVFYFGLSRFVTPVVRWLERRLSHGLQYEGAR